VTAARRYVRGNADQPAALDPLETNRPAPGVAGPLAPAGASGEWSPGWRNCRPASPERREWAAGWDRGARCPADVRQAAPLDSRTYGDHTWRECGPVGGRAWRESHEYRRRVYRACRRAGYVARHRWEVTQDDKGRATYATGPAAGLRAVDPWAVAARLGGCASSWYVQPRITDAGELRAITLPRMCRQAHTCPVCAARESTTLAAGLSALIRSEGGGEDGALITLTHRDRPGETLAAALARLRDAMGRLWSGRARARWRTAIPAHFYGIEVTYNGKANTWHVHAHLVARQQLGPSSDAAEWIGLAWEKATAEAAVAAGLPARYGWDRWAGGVRERGGVTYWVPSELPTWQKGGAWGWYRPLDLNDEKATYQACKYPTCAADLPVVQLAEYLAVAHGRRWHDGGGSWRGARQRADDLAADMLPAVDAHDLSERAPYDIGRNVALCGPGDCPALDSILPGLGMRVYPDEPRAGFARWRLAASLPAPVRDLTCAAAAAAGGRWSIGTASGEAYIELPRPLVAALLWEWHLHGLEARQVSDEKHAARERVRRAARARRRLLRYKPGQVGRRDQSEVNGAP